MTAWCNARCVGRDLDLAKLARWSDRKVVDLMRGGLITCRRCGGPAATVLVSSTEITGAVLAWSLGDDAMPDFGHGGAMPPSHLSVRIGSPLSG